MITRIQTLFNKYPRAAPILSAGFMTCLGDLIAQGAVEGKPLASLDFRRTAQQTSYGLFLIVGIWGLVTVAYLTVGTGDMRMVSISGSQGTMARVALDQLLFTPIFLAIYFAYNAFCEKPTIHSISQKISNAYGPALLSNYKLWPAVQCINFYFVPLNYRLLFVNTIALGWCAYLSHLNFMQCDK